MQQCVTYISTRNHTKCDTVKRGNYIQSIDLEMHLSTRARKENVLSARLTSAEIYDETVFVARL